MTHIVVCHPSLEKYIKERFPNAVISTYSDMFDIVLQKHRERLGYKRRFKSIMCAVRRNINKEYRKSWSIV